MGRPASVDPKGMARETVIPRQADMCPLASARKEDAMIRAALYARYSSDQQSSTSIADQQRICRERAAREGWQIEGAYEDAAIRSEEHTSELQSLMRISYAVFCLKKKKTNTKDTII